CVAAPFFRFVVLVPGAVECFLVDVLGVLGQVVPDAVGKIISLVVGHTVPPSVPASPNEKWVSVAKSPHATENQSPLTVSDWAALWPAVRYSITFRAINEGSSTSGPVAECTAAMTFRAMS